MALPDVTLTIRDGALGLIPASTANTGLKIGCSTLGLVNTIYSVADQATLRTALGNAGPLVEAAALSLTVAGGPLYVVPINPSTYGTVSAVVKTGTGAETLTVAAKNAVVITMKVTTGGIATTSQVAFSFDGGLTYGASVASAATLQVPGNSLTTLAFGAGTYILGDVWTITAAGSASLVGTGAGVLSVSSASTLDAYTAQVNIIAAGALGTATFNYSLDNNLTTSATIVIPVSGIYVIPDTGLVLTFTGTSTAGDFFTFTTTAPSFTSGDLTTTINALTVLPQSWGHAHVVGAAATVSASAAILASLDTLLTAAAATYRFTFAVIEVPSDTDAATIAAFNTASSTRVVASAGYETQISTLTGRQLSRNSAWQTSARINKAPISEDLGRVNSGSLPGVIKLARDEYLTPALDVARFTTLRSFIGRNGYYITNGRVMATAGSDFSFVQNRRVMDVACTTVRNLLLNYVNDSVFIDSVTGFIIEKSAQQIEAFVDSGLRAVLTQPGYASDLSFVVTRTNNIITTQQLQTTLRVIPLGYSKYISVDIGFSNPAIQVRAF